VLATSLTAALHGVEAHLVRVEADTAAGFPKFTMLGLADSCVRESEGRIRAALRNCGMPFKWDRRITVSLAPRASAGASSLNRRRPWPCSPPCGLVLPSARLIPRGQLASTAACGR
jgi:hypothetical protein